MINYNNRIFRAVSNSSNGETSIETEFHYIQNDQVLTAEYKGGKILFGHLIGLIDDQGNIDIRYHQVNINHELMTGICKSTPEMLPNGKIKLHEKWQWTSGDMTKGESIVEEI
jgi:hypothetical protein